MKNIEQIGYRAHAESKSFHKRLEEAKRLIQIALSIAQRPYISFSCGKDSSVLADMVLEFAPDIPMRFLSSGETRLLHNIDEILMWFREKKGAKITEIHINRVFSPEWINKSWNESRKAGVGDLEHLHKEENFDLAFIGLRAEESPNRRMSLMKCRTEGLPQFIYRMKDGRIRCCPLAQWKTADVGAYLISRGIPFLENYHEEGLQARTTARLTGTAVRMGTLRRLKEQHIEHYNAIITRWPELSAVT